MDLIKEMVDGADGPWTEERHSSFLNWVEGCFVRQLFHGGDATSGASPDLAVPCSAAGWRHGRGRRRRDVDYQEEDYHLPLDRYVPDSATESTLDTAASTGRRTKRAEPCPPAHPPAAEEQGKEDEEETADMKSRDRTIKRRSLLLLPRYDGLQEQQVDM